MRAQVVCRWVALVVSVASCEPDPGSSDAGDGAPETVRDSAAEASVDAGTDEVPEADVPADAGVEDVPEADVPVDGAEDVPEADVPVDGSGPDAPTDAEGDARLPDSAGGCTTPLTIEDLRDAVLTLFGTEEYTDQSRPLSGAGTCRVSRLSVRLRNQARLTFAGGAWSFRYEGPYRSVVLPEGRVATFTTSPPAPLVDGMTGAPRGIPLVLTTDDAEVIQFAAAPESRLPAPGYPSRLPLCSNYQIDGQFTSLDMGGFSLRIVKATGEATVSHTCGIHLTASGCQLRSTLLDQLSATGVVVCGGTLVCGPLHTLCGGDGPCCGGLTCDTSTRPDGDCCVPQGASCSDRKDCCNGHFCDPTTRSCVAGVCDPATCCTAVGFACSAAEPCCSTQHCDLSSNRCAAGTCALPGEPCDGGGAPCCPGDRCDPQSRRCVAGCANVGQGCQNRQDCCDGRRCDRNTGTCTDACVDASAYMVCELDRDCCQGRCNRERVCQVCNLTGGSCAGNDGCCLGDQCEQGRCCRNTQYPCEADQECCPGAICHPQRRRCYTPCPTGGALEGEECSNKSDCCSGLRCEPGLQRCASGCADGGGGCVDNSECCSGLRCDQNQRCTSDCARLGERCEADSNCCANGRCQAGQCVAICTGAGCWSGRHGTLVVDQGVEFDLGSGALSWWNAGNQRGYFQATPAMLALTLVLPSEACATPNNPWSTYQGIPDPHQIQDASALSYPDQSPAVLFGTRLGTCNRQMLLFRHRNQYGVVDFVSIEGEGANVPGGGGKLNLRYWMADEGVTDFSAAP